MTLKSHAKFEEKLSCGLENDMGNLTNFIWTLENVKTGNLKVSKIYTLMGFFWSNYIMFELKKV